MKSAQELREALSGLHADALALSEVIDKGGKWTEEQEAEYKALTDDGGKIAKADAELQAREDFDAKRRQIVERNATLNRIGKVAGGPVAEPSTEPKAAAVPAKAGRRSKYFADGTEANLAARWLAYTTATNYADREHHAQQMASLGGPEWDVRAAQSIGTDGKGGYLVPTPISTQIIKIRDEVGLAPRVCNVIGMNSETLQINEETGDTAVQYPGEATAITATDVDFTPHTLSVVKRAALTLMSREFVTDINVSAVDLIVDNFGFKFAEAMDNELLNGDGSGFGGVDGLGNISGTVSVTGAGNTFEELTQANWESTIGGLAGVYHYRSPAWIMSRAAWVQSVLPLARAAGGNTIADLQAGLNGLTWLGYPVFISDTMPAEANDAVAAFFGSYRTAATIGDRNDMSIDTSAERYFESDQIAIRATHRYDILVHKPAAVVKLVLAGS